MVLDNRVTILHEIAGQNREHAFTGFDYSICDTSLRIPAKPAAEAGSQPMPTRSIAAFALSISSSETASTMPSVSRITRQAFA